MDELNKLLENAGLQQVNEQQQFKDAADMLRYVSYEIQRIYKDYYIDGADLLPPMDEDMGYELRDLIDTINSARVGK